MKKLVALLLCALFVASSILVAGCSKREVEVDFGLIANISKDGIVFEFDTNLPEGLELYIDVDAPNERHKRFDIILDKNGNYVSDKISFEKEGVFVGNYTVNVLMQRPSEANKSVQEAIGNAGQYLKGEFVKENKYGENIVVLQKTFHAGNTKPSKRGE